MSCVVGSGGQTSVFAWFKSEHILVLVDGVPMNDPSSPGRAYDFRISPSQC